MGGSGGGFFRDSTNPDDLRKKTREAEGASLDSAFEARVNQFLSDQLAQYNDRDADSIQRIFEDAVNRLGDAVDGSVTMLFGGSIAKHTYVDGLSDVDALVLFDRSDAAGKDPEYLRDLLNDCLSERYGSDAVRKGSLAVTLEVNGTEVQLLPAIKEGNGFKISSPDGGSWSKIQPRKFADALTKTNRLMSGKLIPTVKLAKAFLARQPEQRQLTGYHVESLAIKIFRDYSGPKTPKAMLRHYFEQAASHVKTPVTDSTGQSIHVDEYLGPANSLKRRIVADSMGRIARRIRNADGAGSLESWMELLG